jgi:hypothetical protein
LDKRPLSNDSEDGTQYRLEIPKVSRSAKPSASFAALPPSSPTYSEELQTSGDNVSTTSISANATRSLQTFSSGRSSSTLLSADDILASTEIFLPEPRKRRQLDDFFLNNQEHTASVSSNSQRSNLSYAMDSNVANSQHFGQQSPKMQNLQQKAPKTNDTEFITLDSAVMQHLTPAQPPASSNITAGLDIGQAVQNLINTDSRFKALYNDLMAHKNIFSDLVMFDLKTI